MTSSATFSHQYVTSEILTAKLTIINKVARCFALRGILRRACHCCNKAANGERYINHSCQRGDERAKQKHANNKNGVVGNRGSTTPNAPKTIASQPTIKYTQRTGSPVWSIHAQCSYTASPNVYASTFIHANQAGNIVAKNSSKKTTTYNALSGSLNSEPIHLPSLTLIGLFGERC